jgi:hypothetical protein
MTAQTFAHPGQPNMFARIIAASRHPETGRVVTTLHLRYPRIIHGEVMTHRVFNRNARSSRAVPVKTMLAEIRNDPFVPWHWTRNRKGMQGVDGWSAEITLKGAAAQFVDNDRSYDRKAAWLHGRDVACDLAESYADAEYHKQIVNRLVEPYMWMDLLVTSTHWANFLHLRDHDDAEMHIRDLAVLIGKAVEEAETAAKLLKYGEWHLPYITEQDWHWTKDEDNLPVNMSAKDVLCAISAARCARISYEPFDGDARRERELERFDMLIGNDAVHASPLEHQCHADTVSAHGPGVGSTVYSNPCLHGSLTGFVQHRKLFVGEAIHD